MTQVADFGDMSHLIEEIGENWHSKPITVRVKHSGSAIWLKARGLFAGMLRRYIWESSPFSQ
ncbi:hypothetical protein ACE1CM_07340 [Microseira sp. BLCC-F43]